MPLDTWAHVAATYDGATLRLYVDGTLVASVAATGAIATSTGALRIGGNTLWGEYFQGLIDEVRVYNRALTAEPDPGGHGERRGDRLARSRRSSHATPGSGTDGPRDRPQAHRDVQ